jgi:hypothetical protein
VAQLTIAARYLGWGTQNTSPRTKHKCRAAERRWGRPVPAKHAHRGGGAKKRVDFDPSVCVYEFGSCSSTAIAEFRCAT